MSLANAVFATRYMSGMPCSLSEAFPNCSYWWDAAIAVTALCYDHAITLDAEIAYIWLNKAAGAGNRIGFLLNRYLTEGMTVYVAYSNCQLFIWLFATASSVFVWVSHFIIIARVYTLWDRRPKIKWILAGGFGVATSISMAFAALAAHQAQRKKPWALPFMQGGSTALDLFIIVMTIFNALDRPYQKQADVMSSLQRDGALMFVPYDSLISLWRSLETPRSASSPCFNTRIQLRVEALRFIRYTPHPGFANGLELSYLP
ncbi:hypothetical protein FB451DRAFT_1167565 [Mycena latifolia]|nr:hypothetical protein FB451DRAFT_1167565 [Mycena latifolia]